MTNKIKSKIVIYTAIAGNYDDLIQHTYKSKDFDYVCFTDQKINNPGIWEIRPLDFDSFDNVRNAKYYKVFPDKLFSEYDYSIWVDGNIDVLDDEFEKRIFDLINSNKVLSANIHGRRYCVYQEGEVCIKAGKDDPEIISNQLNYLRDKKFPKNYGLYEMNMIFRKHNSPDVIKLMNDWWDIILNYSRRDQLSFPYVLYKNNMNCETMFKTNARLMSSSFLFRNHGFKITSKVQLDYGDGFIHSNNITKTVTVSGNGNFSVSFDLNPNIDIKKIRYIPVVGKECKLKINELIVLTDDNQKKYNQNEICKICNFNNKNDFLELIGKDPKIDLNLQGHIQKIEIFGEIILLEQIKVLNSIKKIVLSALSEKNKKILKKYWWKIKNRSFR